MNEFEAYSRTLPRTIDGLRVAVAGLANEMPVQLGSDVELPYRLEVLIPYRLRPDSVVIVNRCIEEWNHESER
jgi:hypothetical protein